MGHDGTMKHKSSSLVEIRILNVKKLNILCNTKNSSIYRTDPGFKAGFVFWSGASLLFPMRSSGAWTSVEAPREASPIRNSVIINSSHVSPLRFGP